MQKIVMFLILEILSFLKSLSSLSRSINKVQHLYVVKSITETLHPQINYTLLPF